MKTSKGLFLISVAAGLSTWLLNTLFERFTIYGSSRTFVDLLINISAEELYDRGITLLVFVLFGVITSGIYEKRLAAEEKLMNLAGPLQSRGVVATRDPLPVILADPARLGQLFQNLVGNAIKFCRNETPRIHVSAVRQEKEYIFSVRDNGIGIGSEYLGEIFTAFRRLHKAEEFPGTGLGLATCSRIVEQHGGRIWVESQPGEGSTFFFTIPVKEHESGYPGNPGQ